MAVEKLSIFLAGDSLITRPWSHVQEPAFIELVQEIRAAGVSITNLETVIHEFKGYAQADCGGTYMASPPSIARELKWAGFDMVTHATNHSFDYGSTGVLETIEHTERAGLVLAGSGKDLQAARAPRYFTSNGTSVGLVAMASDFISYGKASYSRPDLPGRPGINPLTVNGGSPAILVPKAAKKRLRYLSKFGFRLRTSDHYGIVTGFRVNDRDLEANLDAVAEAASRATVVVVSVHAHRQGPWLSSFARKAFERGASVVFIHGPHKVLGIELCDGRPIFYSMGDFVYETDQIERFPAEAYEARGLPPGAALDELAQVRWDLRLLNARQTYEGFAASLTFAGPRVIRLRLLPIDLQFDSVGGHRGRPQLAPAGLGRTIIDRVATASERLGTRVVYDPRTNSGEVVLPG